MTIVVYKGQNFRSIIHDNHVRLLIDGIDNNVSLANCDEVYSLKFSLIRKDEDIRVEVRKLHQDGKKISVYTHNSDFAKKNNLSDAGKWEWSGIIDIQESDIVQVYKTDEKTQKVTTIDYIYADFVIFYKEELGSFSTR